MSNLPLIFESEEEAEEHFNDDDIYHFITTIELTSDMITAVINGKYIGGIVEGLRIVIGLKSQFEKDYGNRIQQIRGNFTQNE